MTFESTKTKTMPMDKRDFFDSIIVGAGHAGCEAALACARLGLKTLLLTINIDRIGHLSCNPAIGGLAKGHMVKEIDALGGQMGIWADQAGIQFRTLNTSKGPSVRATRAQIDRSVYMQAVKETLFQQPGLWIREGLVEKLLAEKGRIRGVQTRLKETFWARTVILTTGTFLSGLIHVGLTHYPGGRLGDPPAQGLSASLRDLGFTLKRLKTGTVPRLFKLSVDFNEMDIQEGDNPPQPFSFHSPGIKLPQVPCHITYTNEKTHELIRQGFKRSPLFQGIITGIGARYCPSIEDKVARFPEKKSHQIFVEPEGLTSFEVYPNGIPTSLPIDIQKAMLTTIPGLKRAEIVRPGYGIEYDFVPPTQLKPTLESKLIQGLFMAGQINGTSGYEEAAAQGLWAAINAFMSMEKEAPFVLGRDQAYIAVLVDDLVTKGTNEPYRMFTSRAEYRLLLRENNADLRLTELGRRIGLVSDEHWKIFKEKKDQLTGLLHLLEHRTITPDQATCDRLQTIGATPPKKRVPLARILRQPQITIGDLKVFLPEITGFPQTVLEEAETQIKYQGYLQRQEELIQKFKKLEGIQLPSTLEYAKMPGLSREVVEKLEKIKPQTLGQASRISGITPAAISCIQIQLKKMALLDKKQ